VDLMNPYPPSDDPGGYRPPAENPLYIDPVTGQQLFVDPVTGSLTYPDQNAMPGNAPVPTSAVPPAYEPYSGYPTYGGYPGYGPYGYPASRPTNGLAIGSMVTSITGIVTFWCYGLGGVLGLVGAILGHVALRQIRARDDNGRGMAIAGVIVGWVAVALTIVVVVLVGWAISQINDTSNF
jgi:hypothetical protein